jgi:hypothetical protein
MTFSSDTIYYRKARQGSAFIVSEEASLSQDESFNVHLKNPADSSKSLWVVSTTVSSTKTYSSRVYDAYSDPPSGGSDAEIQNVLMDSENVSDDGIAIANRNVSFTDGTSNHAVGVGGGSGGQSIGSTSQHAPIVMEPDREIVVEVTNESSDAGMVTISVLYCETPV